ncbi:MAG: DUF805 domain-containing protein [Chloroflexota bacterium]
MGPVEAVQTCLRKYVGFSGRASRPEFWWFILFYVIAAIVIVVIDLALSTYPILYLIVTLGLILPTLAAQVRRLHDTDRSGWWWFINFVPLIGGIWLIVLFAKPGTPEPNKYGPSSSALPAAPAAA